jgi:hypothetical protein
MFERRLRMASFRRRIARFYSVLDPLPKLVDIPAQLGMYASVCGTDRGAGGGMATHPRLSPSSPGMISSARRPRRQPSG